MTTGPRTWWILKQTPHHSAPRSARARAWWVCCAFLALTPLAACEGTVGGNEPDTGTGAEADGGPSSDRDAGASGGVDAGAPRDSGPSDRCATVTCGENARCEPAVGRCVCLPGFVEMGGACQALPPGDPAARTRDEVCAQWRAGRVENARDPWIEDPADMCAPGTLSREAIDDTLRRVNVFRWLVGLPPVTDDPAQHPYDQACALMMYVNRRLDHMPPSSWTCWSMEGYQGARTSNLALGVRSPAEAIDLYMDDSGVPSLGHRRWVLNGPLGRVGIGFAGNAQCLGVFDMSGRSDRMWTAFPNPGPVPIDAIRGLWSFHSNRFSMRSATVTVERAGDGMVLPVAVDHPPDGFGPSTVSFEPMGWRPEVGQRYRVTVGSVTGGPIAYEVEPVSC
jgi:hypothetical protein